MKLISETSNLAKLEWLHFLKWVGSECQGPDVDDPPTPGKKFPSQEFPETSFAGRVGDQHVCEHLLPGFPVPSHLPITQLPPLSVFQCPLFRL